MNTQANNKLIAEFMGLKSSPTDDSICRVPDYSGKYILNPVLSGRNYSEWADRYTDEENNTGYELGYHQLDYNSSWDWLMPVLAQIKETERNGNSDYNHLMHTTVSMLVNNGLEATYNHVVRFINWYNSVQNPPKEN